MSFMLMGRGKTLAPATTPPPDPPPTTTENRSILFNGNSGGAGQDFTDRVRVQINQAGNPANVGEAGAAFTVQVWLKCDPGTNNNQVSSGSPGSDNVGSDWTSSAIWSDCDVFGSDDRGGWGIGLTDGRVVAGFGDTSPGINQHRTIVATTDIRDGEWHYIEVNRSGSTARIFVDGQLEVSTTNAPAGDLNIPTNVATGGAVSQNIYWTLGAEKHDANEGDTADQIAYYGHMYDFRVSSVVRNTTNYTRPTADMDTDANTVLHYRLNEVDPGPAVDLAAAFTPGYDNTGEWRVSSGGYPQQAVGDPFEHSYWSSLVANSAHLRSYTGRSNSEVFPTAWANPNNYNTANLRYNPTIDAMEMIYPPFSGSCITQWGPGREGEPLSPPITPTNTNQLIYYWESYYTAYWATRDGDGLVDGVDNNKGYIIATQDNGTVTDDRGIEVRNRFGQASAGEISRMDVRDYGIAAGVTSAGGPGPFDSFAPQTGVFTIMPETWTYFWLLLDLQNATLTHWIGDENNAAVRILDNIDVTINPDLEIIGFFFRHNSSQARTNGDEQYVYDRNLAILTDLSLTQVQALVDER